MQLSRARTQLPRWTVALALVTVAVIVTYVVWTVPGVRAHPGFNVAFDGVLQGAGYTLVAALGIIAAARRRATAAWWAVAAAVVLRAVGFDISLTILSLGHLLPYPSVADAAWALSAVALVAAIVLRLRETAPRLPTLVLIDSAAATLVVLGTAAEVLTGPLRTLSDPPYGHTQIVVNIGYPVLDTALLIAAATLVTSRRSALRAADAILVFGVVAFATIDIAYFVLIAEHTWRPGTMLASFSLVASALVAAAVLWAPNGTEVRRRRRLGELPAPSSAPGVTLPAVLASLAVLGLAVAGFTEGPGLTLVSFGAAVALAIVRALLTLRSDRYEAGIMLGAAEQDVRRFQALVEASTDLIGIADPEGHIVYLNPSGKRMLGFALDDDVTTKTVAQVLGNQARDDSSMRWSALLDSGSFHKVSLLEPADGTSPVPVDVSSFVIVDPATRRPFAVATIQRDISDRLAAEAAVRDLAEQRARLLTRLVKAQEDERARIAADVHDDPVQVLAAVDLRLGVLRRRIAEQAPALNDSVAVLRDMIATANDRLRNLLFELEPPARRTGLGNALADAAEWIFGGTDVRWEVTGDRSHDLPETELITAYRVAKEAIVNVRKHADARRVVIDVRHDDAVSVTVRDDGRGIGPDDERERPGHLGIASMRDRAQAAGGSLEVRRLDTGGTEVRLRLPVPPD